MRPPVARRVLAALALSLALPASAQADAYRACPGEVDVARTTCTEALPVADAARASGGDDVVALREAGWLPLSSRARGGGAEIVAVRGTAVLRYRRPGDVPDVLAAYAGRELVFSAERLVGGQPIPAEAATCTSGFPIRAGRLVRLLSAGHCAANEDTGSIERRYSAIRRPPQPGIVLGTVRRSLFVRTSLDALILRTFRDRGAAPFVHRGAARPPWAVVGTARPIPGRRICFTGVTSGVDRCGRIAGRSGDAAERYLRRFVGARVECTTLRARPGDSGGPVFTRPRRDGTTFALGTSTLVIGARSRLCFTPIAPVLDAFDARLIAAPRRG